MYHTLYMVFIIMRYVRLNYVLKFKMTPIVACQEFEGKIESYSSVILSISHFGYLFSTVYILY